MWGWSAGIHPPVFSFGYREQFVVFFLLGDYTASQTPGNIQKIEYNIQSTAIYVN
jgi:hypothetical protein